jgi:hypothetical protein
VLQNRRLNRELGVAKGLIGHFGRALAFDLDLITNGFPRLRAVNANRQAFAG